MEMTGMAFYSSSVTILNLPLHCLAFVSVQRGKAYLPHLCQVRMEQYWHPCDSSKGREVAPTLEYRWYCRKQLSGLRDIIVWNPRRQHRS